MASIKTARSATMAATRSRIGRPDELDYDKAKKITQPFVWYWKTFIDSSGNVKVTLFERPLTGEPQIRPRAEQVDFFFTRKNIVKALEKNCRHSRFDQVIFEGALARRCEDFMNVLRTEVYRANSTPNERGKLALNSGELEGLILKKLVNRKKNIVVETFVNPRYEERLMVVAFGRALLAVFNSAGCYDNYYGSAGNEMIVGSDIYRRPRPGYNLQALFVPNYETTRANVGTIGRVDHGKTTLTAAITAVLNDNNK